MAIAFDAATAQVSIAGGTYNFTHTCTGSNLYLFVFTGNVVSSVTYAGVSMTQIVSNAPGGGNLPQVRLWGLANPATGLNTVFVTLSGPDSIIAASYTGCNEVQPDAYNNQDSGLFQVSSFASTVTTVKDNSWPVAFVSMANNANDLAAGSGATLRAAGGSLTTNRTAVLDNAAAITPPTGATINSVPSASSGYITSITVSIQTPITMSVNDSITVSENVNIEKIFNVSVSDAITITESVTLDLVREVSVSDAITLSESVTGSNTMGDIVVSDSITIVDSPKGEYYPAILKGFEEMPSHGDEWPLGMDDTTML